MLIITNISCDINNKESKVNSIGIKKVEFDRFDQIFYSLSKSNIFDIKKRYSFLFPANYSNTFWINKSKDTLYNLLNNAVKNKFKNINEVEKDLTHFYKHLKYEFPVIKLPRVISVINNVDYENKIILKDTLLLVSIDSYLGSDHELYDGIPMFVKKNMDINYLESHIAEKYAEKLIKKDTDRTFLSKMIFYGKKLFFKDIIMIHTDDNIKIGYSNDEFTWAKENELFIWQYIIEKQLLYDTDDKLNNRFLLSAPFSKFYLEIDNESPGRIGQWIGWQIVKSYSDEYPNANLKEILSLPGEELFNKSKYKPKRIWQ